MKKILMSMFAAIVGISMIATVGCELSESQVKIMAQQAGFYSAIGWIAIDNPDVETKTQVTAVITIISENSGSIEDGQTYTEAIYPIALEYITNNIKPKDQPVAKAGALAILGGIDILFAANPGWAENETMAVSIVQSFCIGAQSGLALAADDPVIKASLQTSTLRAGLEL